MTLNSADFTLHDVSRFPLVLARACAEGLALVGAQA